VGYILPMLIHTNLLVDQHGKIRVDLEKEFQWTRTLFTELEYTYRQDPAFDSEFAVSLMYRRVWPWAAGLRYTGHSVGAGFEYQF
jgi:hypothetical protein